MNTDPKSPLAGPKNAAEFIEQFINQNPDEAERVPLEQAVQAEMATMNRHQRRAWLSRISQAVGKARAKVFQRKAAPKKVKAKKVAQSGRVSSAVET